MKVKINAVEKYPVFDVSIFDAKNDDIENDDIIDISKDELKEWLRVSDEYERIQTKLCALAGFDEMHAFDSFFVEFELEDLEEGEESA